MSFDGIAAKVAHAVGHWSAIPCAVILLALSGPTVGVDVTNFAISVASLLLLFLLQATQNRDGVAIQTKLDELIRSSSARNEFIGIDQQSQVEIEKRRE